MRCTGSPEKNERKKLDKILTSLKNKIEQKMFKNILAKKNLTFQLMFIQKERLIKKNVCAEFVGKKLPTHKSTPCLSSDLAFLGTIM